MSLLALVGVCKCVELLLQINNTSWGSLAKLGYIERSLLESYFIEFFVLHLYLQFALIFCVCFIFSCSSFIQGGDQQLALVSDLLRHLQQAVEEFDPQRGGAIHYRMSIHSLRPQPSMADFESYRQLGLIRFFSKKGVQFLQFSIFHMF